MSDTVDERIEFVDADDPEVEIVTENNALIANEEELKEVVHKLCDAYSRAKDAMDRRNKRVKRWRAKLEAVHSTVPKNRPFKNASHVAVPMSQIITQGLYAKIKGMFDARDPFWTAKALQESNQEDINNFKVVTKYMDILAKSPYDLNLEAVKRDVHLETCHIGTCFVKVPWTTEHWNLKKEEGGYVEDSGEVYLHDGPEIKAFPVERVTYPQGSKEINRLEWIGLDVTLTESELEERAARGIYDNVEEVLKHKRELINDDEEEAQRNEDLDFSETSGVFDIVEFYFLYDYDKDGIAEDLILHIHPESQTCLKQQLNSFGVRDIVPTRHMHRSFAITGRGSGQMTESLAEEVDAIHNLRNDNMKIANMRTFGVKRTSGISPREEIYPGKLWFLDDPQKDLTSVQMGEVYPSSLQAEDQSLQYGFQAVGMSPTQMGFESQVLKSRDTGIGQQLRMSAGDSILTSISEGLVESWSRIGMLVFMQLVRNKERVIAREEVAKRLSPEDIESLRKALDIPFEQIPLRISFSIKATDAEHTFENQRQNRMTMSQLYSQYSQESMPLASQIFGPQAPQMLQMAPLLFKHMLRLYIGRSKLTAELFKFFGEGNPGDYVPDVEGLDKFLDFTDQFTTPQYIQRLMMGLQGQPQGQPQGGPPRGQGGQEGPQGPGGPGQQAGGPPQGPQGQMQGSQGGV